MPFPFGLWQSHDLQVLENVCSHFFYLNINQLDALNFIMSLFHASTCFEDMCSSSGIITPIGVMIPEAV